MSILSRPYFHDEEAAFAHLEQVMWPNGTECPHCGVVGTGVKIPANIEKRVRYGLWKCGDCKRQFTVRVGTVFEASKVQLHKWLQAVYLMTSNKKGVSAHQMHRALEVTYKTAWFMAHRIREAMKDDTIAGYFSIFKRGMKGVYQHCGKKHLHRYVAEFEFRYNNRSANGVEDAERSTLALLGARGKRLTYKEPTIA